jgi:hypothetical protein
MTGTTKELLAITGDELDYPLPIGEDTQLLFRRRSFSSDIWIARFSEK